MLHGLQVWKGYSMGEWSEERRAANREAALSYENLMEWARDCERILDAWGEEGYSHAVCICNKGVVYEDEAIRIERNSVDQGFQITMAEGWSPSGIQNPVFCRWDDGDVIRTHGEWVYLAKHVKDLASKLECKPCTEVDPETGEITRDAVTILDRETGEILARSERGYNMRSAEDIRGS